MISYRRQLLVILKILYYKGPYLADVGICSNVIYDPVSGFYSGNKVFLRILCKHFKTWKKYCGNKYYPISTKKYLYPEEEYNLNFREGTLWEGKQLKARRSLLLHIIKALTKELKDDC